MKLIDKDALIAEIEKLVSNGKLKCQQSQENNDHDSYVACFAHIATCGKILSLLDTLEVKEDNLFIETKVEKGLAEAYINIFDKKFGNKLPKLKGTQLHDFKNFINTCEQTFNMKYFDYHATQGKLFEKLALLWAVWGKEHLSTAMKDVDLKGESLIGTFERIVKIDAAGYPYIDCSIELYDYDKDIPLAKKSDKVKVIVVKGE